MENNLGLYIHVPFCEKKCPYCDFYSVSYCRDTARLYTDAVIRNIKAYRGNAEIDTIYFGGGTPSILPVEFITSILQAVNENYIVNEAEITIEINPKTVNTKKLLQLRKMGVNRVSIGVQSCVDSELEALGRIHNYDEARKTVLSAYKAGFKNISCDLMLGVIGQTVDSLIYSINQLCKLPISHVSAYMLKIEENTEFNKQNIIDSLPCEDLVSDMYLLMVENLEENGFSQYEISNFSKIGFESKHNLKYWECKEYIGIGPSSHSYFNGKRTAVPNSLQDFIELDRQTEIVTEENPGSFEEIAMLQLRLKEGLCLTKFNNKLDSIMNKAIPFEKMGLLTISDNTIALTAKGFLVSNAIIGGLLL
ncbi:MAG: radical SAM family heme chaperone HemW [Clostridiales bacterium]|nr:radical SAM family heme chaperone HemW [Clostridiales bacterium]